MAGIFGQIAQHLMGGEVEPTHVDQAIKHGRTHAEEHPDLDPGEIAAAKAAHSQMFSGGPIPQNADAAEGMGGVTAIGSAILAQAMKQTNSSGGSFDMNELMGMALKTGSQLMNKGEADEDFKSQVMEKVAVMAFKSQMGGSGGMMSLMKLI